MFSRHDLITYYLISQFGGAVKSKWKTFHHNGVLFPPEYVPHHVPLIYNKEQIVLNPEAEELATLYARYLDTDYVKNNRFNKNFFNDWKKILGKDSKIQDFDKCDFSLIHNYILKQKEITKTQSKEDKEKIKKQKDLAEKKYKFAMVDGKQQQVGNFRIEPPGIFIGRGNNPKLGKIKKRIYPEDITLNLSKDAPIPEPPVGHKWGNIIYDRTVEWLASWKDTITGKTKYVWLSAYSDIKAKSDIAKFDLARKLKKKIKEIREVNIKNLSSDDNKIKQIATAVYLIDFLALRVGNEKGGDETDTVGVTSLRVEHIDLLDNNKIKLDFLGKDSVRYVNTIKVDPQVYKNITSFKNKKDKKDSLFDLISTSDVNSYLQGLMKDLTAKVFRTFNASNLFQKELKKITLRYENTDDPDKTNHLVDEFNLANAKVATLCNHQKSVPKNFKEQVQNINDKIKKVKGQLRKAKQSGNKEKIEHLNTKMKALKIKKSLKLETKNISLNTSKINYIDPRITIAFMKKHNLPVDKIFSKTLQEKFQWAFSVDEHFKF